MSDNTQINFAPYYGIALIVGGVLLLLVFPVVAAIVAPYGRRTTFFVLTLLLLPGPFGVGFAAVASTRPAPPPPGKRQWFCSRCDAAQNVSAKETEFTCWRCGTSHSVH
jgi:hypothetical protein